MTRGLVLLGISMVALVGCGGSGEGGDVSAGGVTDATEGLRAGPGVDVENRVLYIGALLDQSGPAASIGRSWGLGTRILVDRINAGGAGLLPEGWRIELIERDHGYNPQRSVQAYNEIRDRVLYLTTSFGTPTTLPLRPMLERDRMIAIPASASSLMAEHRFTPMPLASYRVEAMRAMDWAVEQAPDPGSVRAAVVYQQDDYGQDGLEGWRAAAEFHGVEIVSEQAVSPGQSDFTATVSTLRANEANFVLIAALPGATSPLLGTAAQLGYEPVWLGNTPSWGYEFFDPSVIPPEVFEKYYNVSSAPFWGEDVPGMAAFLAAYERFGGASASPDWYTLFGYLNAMMGVEAFRIALERGDVTREGYLAALGSIDGYDAGGLLHEPVSLTEVPYTAATGARVLQPSFETDAWSVVAGFAEPKALAAAAP